MAAALPALLLAEVGEKQTIRKTVPAAQWIDVDNIFGSIKVSGYEGREIQMVAQETIRADSSEKVAEARRDVKLDISQQGDTVRFYVDGPFRDQRDRWRDRGRPGYMVQYDFEIKVPRKTGFRLCTVNKGNIDVDGVTGDFQVRNVNGGIQMRGVDGSGEVRTVNGGIQVVFNRNPQSSTSFATINGKIDVGFQPGLSANVLMKTFNGDIYSDFPMTLLPASAMTVDTSDGKRRYRAGKFMSTRVGSGGPEIKFDGFNGEVLIRELGRNR
jgi:hypothetical protein